MIPTPDTSPAFVGELPSRKSPWDEDRANTVPFVEKVDCVATHQLKTYLPGSRNVITPVAGSYVTLPARKTVESKITLSPFVTDPAAKRSICKAILLISFTCIKFIGTAVRFADFHWQFS